LETLVKEAIEKNLDLSQFAAEREREDLERARLTAMRKKACGLIQDVNGL